MNPLNGTETAGTSDAESGLTKEEALHILQLVNPGGDNGAMAGKSVTAFLFTLHLRVALPPAQKSEVY